MNQKFYAKFVAIVFAIFFSGTISFAQTNISLNKPIVVSSAENSAFPGSNAVDGNYTTRWSSSFNDFQWIYVDLEQVYAINSVKIYWETAYASEYDLQMSDDAVNWVTIHAEDFGNGGEDIIDFSSFNINTQYIRVNCLTRATVWGNSIFELEVYEKEEQIEAPIAGFNVETSGPSPLSCEGETVIFTSTSTGDISSQTWDFGANATPQTASGVGPHYVTYSVWGSKTIQLSVTGPGGSDNATQLLNVSALPVTNLTGNTSVQPGGYEWYRTDADANANFNWSAPAGVTIVSGANSNACLVKWEGSSGNITLVKTNAAGCSTTDQLFVTVTTPLTVGPISGATLANEGETKWYSVAPDMTASFAWSVSGDAQIVFTSGNSIQVRWGATSGRVSVTKTRSGASVSAFLDVTVIPAITVGPIVGATAVNEGDLEWYGVESDVNANFAWSVSGDATIVFRGSNLIQVKWGATNGQVSVTKTKSGASATAVLDVTVTPIVLTNIALNKPVTASSIENSGTSAVNVNDGNTGTRWSSAFADGQWIQIDLLDNYGISQIVLNWETAYAKEYTIEVSDDEINWSAIYSTTSSNGGIETTNVSGSGRYIRVYCDVRATVWGSSLYEVEVYGSLKSAMEVTETMSELTVYPNPATDILYIEGADYTTQYIVINASGIIMKQGMGSELNITDLSSGLYLLKAGNQTLRFIKE